MCARSLGDGTRGGEPTSCAAERGYQISEADLVDELQTLNPRSFFILRKVHVDVDVHEMGSERGFEDSDHHASREMVREDFPKWSTLHLQAS